MRILYNIIFLVDFGLYLIYALCHSSLEQVDTIWLDLSPTIGHEQADYRSDIVVIKKGLFKVKINFFNALI